MRVKNYIEQHSEILTSDINKMLTAAITNAGGLEFPTDPTPYPGQFFYKTDDGIIYIYTKDNVWRKLLYVDDKFGVTAERIDATFSDVPWKTETNTLTNLNTSMDIIKARMNTDGFRLSLRNDNANEKNYVELATFDNGNEPIVISQYNSAATRSEYINPINTATLLDMSGDTTFPGNMNIGKNVAIGGDTITLNGINIRRIIGGNIMPPTITKILSKNNGATKSLLYTDTSSAQSAIQVYNSGDLFIQDFTQYDKIIFQFYTAPATNSTGTNIGGIARFVIWDAWELNFALQHASYIDLIKSAGYISTTYNMYWYVNGFNKTSTKTCLTCAGASSGIAEVYGIKY